MDKVSHVIIPTSASKIDRLQTTQPTISIEGQEKVGKVHESEIAADLRGLEVRMEEKTEHAFALMSAIREEIKQVYDQISIKE